MASRHLVLLLAAASMSPLAGAQTAPGLAVRSGFEAGLTLSDYRYREPDLAVSLHGSQAGGHGAYTRGFAGALFGRAEVRAAYGEIDYRSADSGSADAQPNFIFEARALIGRDFFPAAGVALAPYAGIGYRYLYNDLRGETSTGAVGYRRYSQYAYLPLGLAARFSLGEAWVLAPTVEYDYFVAGRQESKLSDTGLGLADAENRQNKGRGYRAALMLEQGRFRFGPWLQVWKIGASDVVRISATRVGREPRNDTREAGLAVDYRF